MPDLDSPLPDWIIDVPGSAGVFERWGLDISCGGKSLEYVCRQAGVDPAMILAEICGSVDSREGDAPAEPRPGEG